MSQTDDRAQLAEHLRFLGELGVAGVSRDPAWRRRVESPVAHESGSPESPLDGESGGAGGAVMETLEMVRADIGDCTRCKLHRLGRTQVVYGVGNPNADLMFVGEAPGHDEDVQGIPFVGRAGQLLTKIIEAIELTRDQVYIANVIKCRPPENRNPEPDEVDTCEPFLFRQVQIIKPKVIVALGTFAARTLLKTTEPISKLRGRFYTYGDAALIATFHPAFLLRSPDRKRDVWDDMKKVRAVLRGDTADTPA
ncbi:MAG: uracil-DNA glycosylase [Acidobacteria bacterium]|nr:uracil-DNA glycosylase [Acidobacteriota bacterium]